MFSKSRKEYGDGYDDKLFEQYRIYLGNIGGMENRRGMMNSFFASINIGLIAALMILIRFGGTAELEGQAGVIVGCIAGMSVGFLWWQIIRSYKSLATVKWDIVWGMERWLPLKIHEVEWQILEGKRGMLQRRLKFTRIESIVAIIFIMLYCVLAVGIFTGFGIIGGMA